MHRHIALAYASIHRRYLPDFDDVNKLMATLFPSTIWPSTFHYPPFSPGVT